jgi:membrane protein YdbS with pleckstrin-like domain
LRFDLRRRLMLGLLAGLFFALVMGMAVLFLFARVSPWIWAVPLLGIYIFGTVLIFAHGDKIVVAEKS